MAKAFFKFLFCTFFCPNTFAQQLVLPGDYPDPSVVKIGDTYWASATTSNWFPAYPLMRSKDLVNWKQQGYVFNQLPRWADFYFWAPEISYEKGKVYVYYAAHKKNGNLCVGVASADKPEGPYKDHGPLICQEAGSIDAFPMRDEKEKLFLIWKEDANSVQKPTPIWARQMNEARTGFIGEKKELFRNTESWEGNLVEGVSMVKHGGYFYAFYAAAGCCGERCNYTMGIARSKKLLGPWEKYKEPVVTNTNEWICPGHGTPVEKNGKHYFLYHAYDKQSNIFTGKQGLLIEYKFTPDGWIEFIKEENPKNVVPAASSYDDFSGNTLADKWQWSVFQKVNYKIRKGSLELPAIPAGGYIGRKVETANYNATTLLDIQRSTAFPGIGIIGDDKNYIAAIYIDGSIQCIQVKDGKEQSVGDLSVPVKKEIHLRVNVTASKNISFSYSVNGSRYTEITTQSIDASYLPPWDGALRVGLISKGKKGEVASFKNFTLANR